MKKLYYLLLTLLITSASYGQELLLNGDFEAWDDATSPTSWTKAESTDQESTEIHGGTYAAKHTGGTSDISQTVTGIIPGNSYTITMWYKVDGGAGDGTDGRIWSYWRNSGSNITDSATSDDLRGPMGGYFDANGNAWTEYTVTVTAPATANEFYFEVRTYGSAIMYWDDFSFFAEAASSDPALVIGTPSEGSTILTDNVDVSFIVSNFDVQDGTGDGRIRYTLDGGSAILKTNTDPISLTGLTDGAHTVYMELVDNSNAVLSPEVNATVNFTTNNIVQTLPYYEPFDYTASENLGDQNIWINNFSGDEVIINNGSLSYSTLSGTSNSITFDGSGADPSIDYTPTSSGEVFASFILNVTDLSAFTTSGYFGVLREDGGNYASRLWIDYINTSTFNIGISSGGTLTETTGPYTSNTPIFIVFSYDIDNDTVNAWINPTLGGSEPAADITEASGNTTVTLTQFLIRQDSASETPFITMDELQIGTTWADVTPTALSITRNEIEGFAVYPNPVNNGEFTIRSLSNASKQVQIFDMLGKQVYQKDVQVNENVQISNLNSGIYILKVLEEGKTATRKLVVQ